jgi:hypothetical protein
VCVAFVRPVLGWPVRFGEKLEVEPEWLPAA